MIKKKIIFIASYPKSGSTWIRILLSSIIYSNKGAFEFRDLKKIQTFSQLSNFENLKNYKIKNNNLDPEFTVNNWINAQKRINIEEKKTKFFKTHNIRGIVNKKYFTDKSVCAGFIYIVRDPRDVVISKAHYNGITIDESIQRMLFDEKVTTTPNNVTEYVNTWKNHVISWYSFKDVPRLFIRYEDMINKIEMVISQLFEFINENSTYEIKDNQHLKSNILKTTDFKRLQNTEKTKGFVEKSEYAPFFRSGKSQQWKTVLTKKQIGLIEKNLMETMRHLNYI